MKTAKTPKTKKNIKISLVLAMAVLNALFFTFFGVKNAEKAQIIIENLEKDLLETRKVVNEQEIEISRLKAELINYKLAKVDTISKAN